MINVNELLGAGYKTFQHPFHKALPNYLGSYQKFLKDNKGQKYYINIHNFGEIPQYKIPENFSAESQLNGHSDNEDTFNVEYFIKGETTLAQIENWFEKLWTKMSADYYERNE
jgi:hypothetical protein